MHRPADGRRPRWPEPAALSSTGADAADYPDRRVPAGTLPVPHRKEARVIKRDPLRRSRLGFRGLLIPSAGVLLFSSVLLLPACTVGPEIPEPPASEVSNALPRDPLPEAGTIPVDGAGSESLLPVYWLGGDGGAARLYREFLRSEVPGGDPIAEAVRLMTAARPFDPDFRSLWEPASMVSSSISARNVITVDISADAFRAGLDDAVAGLAIQQLVFTATAAASNAGLIDAGEASSVVLLVDGKAGFDGFGPVSLDGELRRDGSLVAPVWVIDPQHGDVRDPSTVVVTGTGTSGSASLSWRITSLEKLEGRASPPPGQRVPGATVKEGSVRLDSAAGSPGGYEFTVALPPGRYEISVFRVAGDGGQHEEFADTKLIEIK
jgi:hypothetical protein